MVACEFRMEQQKPQQRQMGYSGERRLGSCLKSKDGVGAIAVAAGAAAMVTVETIARTVAAEEERCHTMKSINDENCNDKEEYIERTTRCGK